MRQLRITEADYAKCGIERIAPAHEQRRRETCLQCGSGPILSAAAPFCVQCAAVLAVKAKAQEYMQSKGYKRRK